MCAVSLRAADVETFQIKNGDVQSIELHWFGSPAPERNQPQPVVSGVVIIHLNGRTSLDFEHFKLDLKNPKKDNSGYYNKSNIWIDFGNKLTSRLLQVTDPSDFKNFDDYLKKCKEGKVVFSESEDKGQLRFQIEQLEDAISLIKILSPLVEKKNINSEPNAAAQPPAGSLK